MPTYDYTCEGCGRDFELVQKMTDAPIETCPDCGQKVTRKIGAGAGLLFKGSGFYITDYRSPDYKSKEKAEKTGAPAAAGGGSGESSGSGGDKGTAEKAGATGPAKESASGGEGSGAAGDKKAAKASGDGSAAGSTKSGGSAEKRSSE